MADLPPHPPPTRPTARAGTPRRLAAIGAVVVVALLLQVPLPLYVQQPGPVFPLGAAVRVEGGDPIDGDFLFTTIQLGDADLLDVLAAAVDPDALVVSRAAVLGGQAEDAFLAEQQSAFDQAERIAARVGLAAVGSDLDPGAVEVRASGVGGPSAALLIALAVADLASADDLAAGRMISGTGALRPGGAVGPVGSVTDKLRAAEAAGADVFIVAVEQLEEAQAAATSAEVIGVASAAAAVAALLDR